MHELINPASSKDLNPIPNQTGSAAVGERTINIYGRTRFAPEQAREHVIEIKNEFKTFYSSLGYVEHPSVLISSGVDPTVRFIGSHISVFKPYLVNSTIPRPGYFIVQDCIRTKNLEHTFDDNYFPKWGSYFPSLGVIAQPEELKKICIETFKFFEERLRIPKDYIRIRINSTDVDFLEVCSGHYQASNIEVDSKPKQYYQHRIGMEEVKGHSFNIALRDVASDTFSDVGNIISLENARGPLGIEVALGSTIILKQLYDLDHVLDCNPVIGLHADNLNIKRKFEDTVVVSTILRREGLKPTAHDNRGRLLRSYMRSLSYFRTKTSVPLEDLFRILSNFESKEFPDSPKYACNDIIHYLRVFENDLIQKKDYSLEEKKIALALQSIK